MPNCNTSDLGIFVPDATHLWNKKKIQHIYRRFGFGASDLQITQALAQTPSNFIDTIINQTIALGSMPPPAWSNMSYSDYTDFDTEVEPQHVELYSHFENDMLNNSLRGRFTMFWHNHFVTRLDDVWCPSWEYDYYQTLQTYAFGNFKDFVRAIGVTPAMITFLNGYQNTATSPNENYAREFYELFTLGVGNGYTQTDIVETARAFTGYTGYTDYCAPITFNTNDFDSGSKAIFNQTGNWGYDDVIDILFQEKADLVANYICTKLYAYFVSPEINETIVTELANTFVANNFELVPVYKQLFKSNHFFDELAMGTIVKSPYDVFNCFFNDSELFVNEDFKLELIWFNGQLGQYLLDPTDVAGWQGNHDWINSSTLIGRWQGFEWFLWDIWDNQNDSLKTLALRFADITETDPALITQLIVDHFITAGLQTAEDYAIATDVFKDQVPQNYYDDNIWNLSWDTVPYQVIVLLFHIVKLPEFQLK